MGVKGLWKLIESTGVPVPLETLEHKVIGVDVSIWLHQAVRGFRGPGGAAVANAHLLTLFHRICKLLFYRIRPVFVFDGGVPHLKKQTLASRKLKRTAAANKAKQVRERLLNNLLKSQAVRSALGRSIPAPGPQVPRPIKREKDMFELPPLPVPLEEETSLGITEGKKHSNIIQDFNLPNLHQFDFESEEFRSLPMETQHEILSELQGTRKQNSWASINDMPQQSDSFAAFQMGRLMKRAKFQATLDSTRDEIRKAKISEMEEEMFGELEKHVSLSCSIISEDSSHALLIKKVKETEEETPIDREKEIADTNIVTTKDRKGKAPMKKNKGQFSKDFLTELSKQGVIRTDDHLSDSDSNDENDSFFCLQLKESEQDWGEDQKQRSAMEDDESFLQVVGSLMENSGLTQDEILALIKHEQKEDCTSGCKNQLQDGPCTSVKAPGIIFNPDADSSEDEDDEFIEVPAAPQLVQMRTPEEKEQTANNIDKLLGTKTNSLWMKLIQQKVDDMVYVDTLKTSPKKAVVDSRKFDGKVNMEVKKPADASEALKPVKISLDFEVKPLKMEDNIFSDIFTDLGQPALKKTQNNFMEEPQKARGPNQTITGQALELGNSAKKNVLSSGDMLEMSSDSLLASVSSDRIPSHKEIFSNTISDTRETSQLTTDDRSEDLVRKISNSPSLQALSRSFTDTIDNESLKEKVKELVKTEIEKLVSFEAQKRQSEVKEAPDDDVEMMSSNEESEDEEDETCITLPASSKSTVAMGQNNSSTQLISSKNQISENPISDNTELVSSEKIVLETQASTSNTSLICQSHKHGSDPRKRGKTCIEQNIVTEEEKGEARRKCKIISPPQPPKNNEPIISGENKNQQMPSRSPILGVDVESTNKVLLDSSGGKKGKGNKSLEKEIITVDREVSTDNAVEKSQPRSVGNEHRKDEVTREVEFEDTQGVERPLDYTQDELKHLEGELASEQQALVAQAQKSERIASSLNDQMYGESQHLLQLFGIPYLVAPMEAEAQCAFLNAANLTEGTVTDDSDIFLFGGSKVYRNFFNQTRHVELFKTDNIRVNIGLDQDKMITLALLTGSDYTEGLEGVGAVGAMEILTEFPGEGIHCLHNLKKWWDVSHRSVSGVYSSKIRQKLTQVTLSESFPDERIYEAYLNPEVDTSLEKFTWAVPNVDALRIFTGEKFGWNSAKTDEILLPVMKKLRLGTSQMRIDSYFTNIKLVKDPKITSKRMQDAIAKAKGEKTSDSCTFSKVRRSNGSVEGKSRQKKRAVEPLENESQVRESEPDKLNTSKEAVLDDAGRATSSESKRTLLIDPSESSSPSVAEKKRGRKRKAEQCKPKSNLSLSSKSEGEGAPQRKLTKEDMYKVLLEKETISQREKSKQMMQEKRLAAANILQKQSKLKKVRKR